MTNTTLGPDETLTGPEAGAVASSGSKALQPIRMASLAAYGAMAFPLAFVGLPIYLHAGIGLYDLTSEETQKTGEWQEGIGKVLSAEMPEDVSELLAPWLSVVRALNPDGELKAYPGSPCLARDLVRKNDRLTLTELHPADFRALSDLFSGDFQVKTIHLDGWLAMIANSARPTSPRIKKRIHLSTRTVAPKCLGAPPCHTHITLRSWALAVIALVSLTALTGARTLENVADTEALQTGELPVKIISINIEHLFLGDETLATFLEQEKPDILVIQEALWWLQERRWERLGLPVGGAGANGFPSNLKVGTMGSLVVYSRFPILQDKSHAQRILVFPLAIDDE